MIVYTFWSFVVIKIKVVPGERAFFLQEVKIFRNPLAQSCISINDKEENSFFRKILMTSLIMRIFNTNLDQKGGHLSTKISPCWLYDTLLNFADAKCDSFSTY